MVLCCATHHSPAPYEEDQRSDLSSIKWFTTRSTEDEEQGHDDPMELTASGVEDGVIADTSVQRIVSHQYDLDNLELNDVLEAMKCMAMMPLFF